MPIWEFVLRVFVCVFFDVSVGNFWLQFSKGSCYHEDRIKAHMVAFGGSRFSFRVSISIKVKDKGWGYGIDLNWFIAVLGVDNM